MVDGALVEDKLIEQDDLEDINDEAAKIISPLVVEETPDDGLHSENEMLKVNGRVEIDGVNCKYFQAGLKFDVLELALELISRQDNMLHSACNGCNASARNFANGSAHELRRLIMGRTWIGSLWILGLSRMRPI